MKEGARCNFVLLLTAFIVLCSGAAFAEGFSADMVSHMKNQTIEGKLFISGQKSRMETGQSTIITRMDMNVSWMLMPAQKMYMEMPIQSSQDYVIAGKDKVPGEVERQSLGEETINGVVTEKTRIVYKSGKIDQTVLTWIPAGSPFPIKTAAEDGSWSMEYKNIQTGTQDADLFEIPAGYQKMQVSLPALSEMGNVN